SVPAAGELLAERLKGLVGGQAAAGLLGRRLAVRATRVGGVRGVRRRLGRGDLGHLGLGLLLDVSLPALVRLGVLLLPRRALLVEALEPLARLRVEAPRGD